MNSSGILLIYLIFYLNQLGSVICDGDHAHAHGDAATSADTGTSTHTTSTGPEGSVTTVHTTSGDAGGGHNDAFAGILSGVSPELVSSLSRNPQVAQYLRAYGIDPGRLAASKAAAEAGGSAAGGGGYDYPPPPSTGGLGGGLGGLPFPPFFGPYKQLHVSGDFGGYYLIVKKAIIVIGGAILILVILALLAKGFAKGGLLFGLGTALSEALAGAASVDLGPFHKSVAGAASINADVGAGHRVVSTPENIQLTQHVYDSLDQRF